ncbi:hypothetical protein LguiB_013467 [Lonicera macranthoides]
MKQIIRETSQWCDEFIGEEEKENHNNPNIKESGEIEKKTEELAIFKIQHLLQVVVFLY